ncbi:MAG: TonB-dependent receptor [Chitinophagaceae bacterium]|nr:TonB-dependent receptor [Chitinophagaceae bacterium]
MNRIFFVAAAIFSLQTARAQDSAKILDEVIVTATKTPVKQSLIGKTVTVISHKMIQENAGKTLPELMNMTSGITINGADNPLGTAPAVFLRGASSGNTLILLDGIPLYDPSSVTGEFDLNNFDLNTLQRIEIMKGSQSTLYGSDAVAGVINLITTKESDKKMNLNAQLSAGSYNTYRGNLTISGKLKKGSDYLISYSKLYSKGFSSAYDSTGKGGFDRDGFNRDLFMAKFGWKINEGIDLKFFGKYSRDSAAIDAGAFIDDKDYTFDNNNTIAGVMLDKKLKNGLLRIQYYSNWYNRHFVDDSTDVPGFIKFQKGRYNGFSHYAEAFTNLKLSDEVTLLSGVDYRYNSTSQLYFFLPDFGFPAKPISPDSAHTHQISGYASLLYNGHSGFGIETGGRFNHHNVYGGNYTSTLNPFFNFGKFYKVYANLSSGYHVPTLYQLYSEYGNKSLRPESDISTELGIQYNNVRLYLRATAYSRTGRDVIFFYSDPITFAGKYMNGDKQKDKGFETEIRLRITEKISFSANYTYTDGKITTLANGKDSGYFNLYKRPENMVNASVNLNPAKALYIGINFHAAGKSFEANYMSIPYVLDGYYTLGAHVNYKATKCLTFFTDIQNLTNRKYFTSRGYNTRGFNLMAGAMISL